MGWTQAQHAPGAYGIGNPWACVGLSELGFSVSAEGISAVLINKALAVVTGAPEIVIDLASEHVVAEVGARATPAGTGV